MLGKLLGFVFGAAAAGFFGAIVGVFIGSKFDDAFFKFVVQEDSSKRHKKQNIKAQAVFFETVFKVIGYISKFDGRVSEKEIEAARKVMLFMNLSSVQKLEAIEFFNQGKSRNFELNVTLAQFMNVCGNSYPMLQMFLEFQLTAAYFGGNTMVIEQGVLDNICYKIGIPIRVLRRLQKQFEAEYNFTNSNKGYSRYNNYNSRHGNYYNQNSYSSNNSALDDAYVILGVNKSDLDATVKRAYRKLMSQHHPDKLMAKGVPEEMLKMATQKSQKIQAAYDLVAKSRGMK